MATINDWLTANPNGANFGANPMLMPMTKKGLGRNQPVGSGRGGFDYTGNSASNDNGVMGANWMTGVNTMRQPQGPAPTSMPSGDANSAWISGAPGGGAMSTPDYPTTLGGMASGFPTNAVDDASQGNYTAGMKLSDYLNPAADWARQEGLKAVQSSYAGAGDFLSGNAMKGISDYTTKSALNSEWQPAFNNYMLDKNFNYNVDSGDRAFNYGADKDLANLGLAGTQGQASSNSWLATLLAQLAQNAGQTQGAGTIGQSNALTGAISGGLNSFNQNQFLNAYLKANGLGP